MNPTEKKGPDPPRIFFMGLRDADGRKVQKKYPVWRYHENGLESPVYIRNSEEDAWAERNGFKEVNVPMTQVRYLMNWRFDLEDFTAKQLVQFAREEFAIDLPVEAGREKLFKAIWQLHVNAPENRNDVVLFAQSVEMNYDETLEAIKRMIKGVETELVEEFYA